MWGANAKINLTPHYVQLTDKRHWFSLCWMRCLVEAKKNSSILQFSVILYIWRTNLLFLSYHSGFLKRSSPIGGWKQLYLFGWKQMLVDRVCNVEYCSHFFMGPQNKHVFQDFNELLSWQIMVFSFTEVRLAWQILFVIAMQCQAFLLLALLCWYSRLGTEFSDSLATVICSVTCCICVLVGHLCWDRAGSQWWNWANICLNVSVEEPKPHILESLWTETAVLARQTPTMVKLPFSVAWATH